LAEEELTMSGQDERQSDDGALAEELKAHHAVMVADLDRLSTALASAGAAGADATECRTALTSGSARSWSRTPKRRSRPHTGLRES
jgi:hypothetical protein